jgi:hypothetical protein
MGKRQCCLLKASNLAAGALCSISWQMLLVDGLSLAVAVDAATRLPQMTADL